MTDKVDCKAPLISQLTDEAVAFILFCAQTEEEREGFYRRSTTAYWNTVLRIKCCMKKEYEKRNLHHSMFETEEE